VALYRLDDEGRHRLVIVPKRKELPRGTLKAILEQAGLTTEAFVGLL
jgi:predicted RNA binding protein YcfA (HicA-like mRNA interferase family)